MQFNIIHINETGSTNALALQKIMAGEASEGTIFCAGYQTKGKGTGNNSWESQRDKNLLFSLVLEPRFLKPPQQFLMTQIVSVSLKELLEQEIQHYPVTIKWPNDIYAGKKKIAGVLIQNIIKGDEYSFAVVGIGINVNQEQFYSDAPNPVSIIKLTGKSSSLTELLHRFLSIFQKYYESKKQLQKLKAQYKEALFQYKEPAKYLAEGKKFEAIIEDVTEYGQLILRRTGEEKTTAYHFKEVSFLL